ncbi:hypothetical protein KQX54_018441 [Cotesia glomerata]|uniref:Uncharacterized protein n=1 Tax=Cotesia glomerata TaxID=32391 RepID=A0AAV7IER7_COTGL|nr:hypothetical protein KQX54_018441 [Cotesia glomerata]
MTEALYIRHVARTSLKSACPVDGDGFGVSPSAVRATEWSTNTTIMTRPDFACHNNPSDNINDSSSISSVHNETVWCYVVYLWALDDIANNNYRKLIEKIA